MKKEDDAFDFVIRTLEKYREQFDINYELKPYDFDRDLGDLLERYKDGLSPEKWCTIKIHDFNNKSKIIWNMQKELSDKNITFDTGSDFKTRDWELDWSFKVGE